MFYGGYEATHIHPLWKFLYLKMQTLVADVRMVIEVYILPLILRTEARKEYKELGLR